MGERSQGMRVHWPIAVALALTALFLAGGLLPGRVFFHRDLGRQFFPVIAEARQAPDGSVDLLPFWTSASSNGRPHVANPGYSFLSPFSLLWLVLPHAVAFDLFLVLHAMLGAAGMALLARALGASPGGTLLAGVAMGLGGGTVSALDLWWALVAYGWAPWVLLAAVHAVESPSARRWALLALALALQANGGMPEVVLATLVVGAVLALVRTPGTAWRRAGRTALTFGACGVWGILIASPQLIPAALHARTTQRAWGFTADGILFNSLDPRALPGLVLPGWGGHPMERLSGGFPGGKWTDTGTPYLISSYCGAFVALLAAWALLAWARRRLPPEQARLVPALTAVAVAGILVALGRHLPPMTWIAEALAPLPLRYTVKALFATFLVMPLLAALGLDALLARAGRPRLARGLAILLPLAVALDLQLTHRGFMPTIPTEQLAEPPLAAGMKSRARALGIGDGSWFIHHERRPEGEWHAPVGSLELTEEGVFLWQHAVMMPPLGMNHGIRHAMDAMADRLEDTCIILATRNAYAADRAEWARRLGEAGVLFVISPSAELSSLTGDRLQLEQALGPQFGVPPGSGFVYRNLMFRPRFDVVPGEEAGAVVSWSDDHRGMTVSVSAARDLQLAVRENLGPLAQWRASGSDGTEFALRRLEPCGAVVDVPRGEWTIRFDHVPPGWHLGLGLCTLALCAAALAMLPRFNPRG